MIRRVVCALVVLAAAFLAGCGGGTDSVVSDPTALVASQILPNGLTASLSQDKTVVATQSEVTYTVALANTTSAPITFTTRQNNVTSEVLPETEIRITDASGNFVNGRSKSASRLPPLYGRTSVTLAPGQSLSYAYPFPTLFAKPGRYQATARFSTDESGGLSATVGPLVIVAR